MIAALVQPAAFALVLAPVPAFAGAGGGPSRPPVALTAAPARLELTGSTRSTIQLTNSGTKRVLVDVSRAGFALDLRGRPRIVRGGVGSAAPWLTVRPSHFAVGPRSSALLVLAAKLPRRPEPGDHDAVVLLSTRPLAKGRVAVRLRLGVVVIVRTPGRVVRRLELRGLRVIRRPHARLLDVLVANGGNVTEPLNGARAVLSSARNGRRLATLVASSRNVRPRTRGILEFRLRGRAHGRMTARVVIPADSGRAAIRRVYAIKL